MSLAGRIDAFPIPEVLRLLARSEKTGCLRVDSGGVHGKVYLWEGKIAFGTTRHEESVGEDIVAAGLVDSQSWLEVERREKTIAEVLTDSKGESDLERFVRELVTDVVFRIQRNPDGSFDFEDEAAPRYDTGQLVDVEAVLAETELRVNQWRDIEDLIPGVSFRLRMTPELTGKRDVTLTGEAWRMLAALEGAASIADVAEKIGSTDFQVGKALADLVRDGLVEVIDEVGGGQYYYGDDEEASDSDSEDSAESEESSEDVDLLESVISDVNSDDSPDQPKRRIPRRRGLGSLGRDQ